MLRPIMRHVGVLLLLSFMIAIPVRAQEPAQPAARIVIIKPKDGMQKQFEDGYKRHLEWHRQHNDPWVWYGWQILAGDRLRYFMDGTFGHRWEDFDAPVDPAGDAADNALNVMPYGGFISLSHYVLLPEISTSRLLEEASPSAFIELLTYRVYPGKESEFERVLRGVHEAYGKTKRPPRYTWYKLVSGGERPAYLLMLPIDKLADLQAAEQSFTAVLSSAYPEREARSLLEMFRSSVREVRSEMLRYRADMSYFPSDRR